MVLVSDLERYHATAHVLLRPSDGKKCVEPRALHQHRKERQFLGPCCLCPLSQKLSDEPAFIEAAIYIPVFGRFGGEYVAECAESRCGYLGQSPFSLMIDRIKDSYFTQCLCKG